MLTPRTQTSFRLSTALLDNLRNQATSSNQSLNSYVELLLKQSVSRPPASAQLVRAEMESRLRSAFHEIKEYKEGKIQLKRAEDLLNEL